MLFLCIYKSNEYIISVVIVVYLKGKRSAGATIRPNPGGWKFDFSNIGWSAKPIKNNYITIRKL